MFLWDFTPYSIPRSVPPLVSGEICLESVLHSDNIYSCILLYLLALSRDVSGRVPEVTWPIIMLIMLIMHDVLSVCYVSLWI